MLNAFNDLIENLTECAVGARNQIQDGYNLMADEEDISSRFTQELESQIRRVNTFVSPTLIPRSITLPRRYPYSESKFGADFAVAYKLQLDSYSYGSGILVQAKRKESSSYNNRSARGLRDDCIKMLDCSPDSFVCVFSNRTFRHYPACSISGLHQNQYVHGQRQFTLNQACPSHRVGDFYKMLFTGFIGDRWVYENLDHLSRPDRYAQTPREVLTDGGELDKEGGGITTFLIVATDSPDDFDPYNDLPYNESFIESELPSSNIETDDEMSGQTEFGDFL